MKKRVFSGIQPTGVIHIGNYIGALKNWVAMQDDYDCLYCIVDLHALTVPQDPGELRESVLRTAAATLAVGIDPRRSLLFVQSDVAEHAELSWVLNCFTYVGELNRMTQYKDKSTVRGEGASVGLFDYPVLMAADILLYNTHAVPVGDDQRQHLELTREIARRVNKRHPRLFEVPEPFIGERGARVMGLDDPTVKMSKSAASELNYIAFSDSPDLIRRKIKRAVTDSGREVKYDEKNKPAVSNLMTLYAAFSGRSLDELQEQYAGRSYGEFKRDLGEVVVRGIAPLQKRIAEFQADLGEVERILEGGTRKARELAQPRMAEIRKAMGLGR